MGLLLGLLQAEVTPTTDVTATPQELTPVEALEAARLALEELERNRDAAIGKAGALATHVQTGAESVAIDVIAARPTASVITDILLHSSNETEAVRKTEALLTARASEANDWLFKLQEWFLDYSLRTIGALITLIIGWMVARWISQRIGKWLTNAKRIDTTVANYIETLVRTIIIIVTLIAVLGKFGVQTASIVGVISAASLAIGLALQGTLANFAAGVMLLIFRPFREGDEVEIANQSGNVTSIGVFATEITAYSGEYIMIPNGEVWGKTIKNLTRNGRRRFEIKIEVAHSNDTTETLNRVRTVLAEHEEVLETPGPIVQISDISSGGYTVRALGWGNAEIIGGIRSRVMAKIKNEFDRTGIDLPQTQVHLFGEGSNIIPPSTEP